MTRFITEIIRETECWDCKLKRNCTTYHSLGMISTMTITNCPSRMRRMGFPYNTIRRYMGVK